MAGTPFSAVLTNTLGSGMTPNGNQEVLPYGRYPNGQRMKKQTQVQGTQQVLEIHTLTRQQTYLYILPGKTVALVAQTGLSAVTDHDLDAPVVCIV
eukprot:882404-Pleurochrysis_carterae.AAC.1